jgi:hypothetical protein
MTRTEICEAHANNRAKLSRAITHLEIALNTAIRSNHKEQEHALVRVVAMLRMAWMAWMESSFSCILHSKNVLTDKQVIFIRSYPNEITKWHGLCEFLFRLQYLGGKQKQLNRVNLGVATFTRYSALKELLDDYIAPFIERRNKLAHGQWHVALTNDGTSKNPDMTSNVWTLSKKELLLMKSITEATVRLFGMLIVGTKQFESDFDKVFGKIDLAAAEIERRYADAMKALKRSISSRQRNICVMPTIIDKFPVPLEKTVMSSS